MSEHKSLVAAMVAAQGDYPPVEKKSVNPHFKKNYADLAGAMEVIRPVLTKHGIAFTQTFHVADGVLMLRTSLMHGAESMPSELPISQPANPQDFVKLTTYYRRVALFSMLGITPVGEDDDGNSIANVATTQEPPPRQQRPPAAAKPNGTGAVRSPAEEVDDAQAALDAKDPLRILALPLKERIQTLEWALSDGAPKKAAELWLVYSDHVKALNKPKVYDALEQLVTSKALPEPSEGHRVDHERD
jgi:hypothetical protein